MRPLHRRIVKHLEAFKVLKLACVHDIHVLSSYSDHLSTLELSYRSTENLTCFGSLRSPFADSFPSAKIANISARILGCFPA